MSEDLSSTRVPIKAVIFDMDGLLLDSETLAMEAMISAGTSLGYDMPVAFCRHMIGVAADGCRRLVAETYGTVFPIDAFFETQEYHLLDLVNAGRLALKDGVLPLLRYLETNNIPRAIATSSSRCRTDHHLALVGLDKRFDTIVKRDDVKKGKPDPEPYLTAANRLGVSAANCLALEDSHNGVRAAHAANIRVMVVPDLLEPTDEVRQKAVAVVEDLHAVMPFIESANI
jgi:HAD superfamily hydrolase (TIGR01509 family)